MVSEVGDGPALRPEDLPRVDVRPSDPAFNQNPYATYAKWHGQHHAFWWEAYGHTCFASFNAVDGLLRDRRFGREILHVATREELGLPEVPDHLTPFYDFESRSMLEREPPVHTRLRRLVNRAFVSRAIERLRPEIEDLAHRLIDGFEGEGEADLIAQYATPIPVAIIAGMLGVPVSESDRLLDWSHKMVAMYQFNRTRAVEDEAVRATLEFSDFIGSLIDGRDGSRADDLLGHLMEAHSSGDALTRDELITTCILLLNAGHEATVHAIGNSVRLLLRRKAAGFDMPDMTPETIEELLRVDPPLHMFTRYALEDCEAFGVFLKKGEVVGLLLGAANHDPARFDRPGDFWPERPNPGHVSFGAGLHFCIGAPLARLEMQLALPILFERLPNLRILGEPTYADRYHFHGLNSLAVQW